MSSKPLHHFTLFRLCVFFLTILALFTRFYNLDGLPSEPWGDLNEHIEIAQYLKVHLFWTFYFGGDGPIFSYLLYALAFIFGFHAFTEKLVTALIGITAVFVSYFFSLSLFPRKIVALTTTFLTIVSFWTITFSRQGKPHILVTLFAMLVVLALRKKKHILAGLLIILGMFTQAGAWGIIFFSLYHWKTALTVGSIAVVALIVTTFSSTGLVNSLDFFKEKLSNPEHSNSITFIIHRVSTDFFKNSAALFTHGDAVRIHTIASQPHLDEISRVLLVVGIVGMVWVIYKQQTHPHYFFYLVLPYLFLQIPSILDINNPLSSPNMGRTLVLTPFLFFIISWGIYFICQKVVRKNVQSIFVVTVLGLILTINIYRYFVVYPRQLPHQNTSFSKEIIQFIEALPDDKKVTIVGCCWSEGIPEPKSIKFNFHSTSAVQQTTFDEWQLILTGEYTGPYPHYILLNPSNDEGLQALQQRYVIKRSFLLEKNGFDISRVLEVQAPDLDTHLEGS